MALSKRVEVLFDPKDYQAIEELARSTGQTVGSLVRRAVEQQYLHPTLEQRRAAIQRFLNQPDIDLGTWEEAKAAIEKEAVKRFEAP
ncbi:MAG: ribbon-helix-helix protein, CopG family [Chloroflexota bacterium]|nr:ribbon-helix-helix protein, CopG family [Chloroflexota bacterium]